MEKQSTFSKLGFEMEAFGHNTIIVRSVPDLYDGGSAKPDFLDILDRWMKTNTEGSAISDEILNLMSCKGALKANTKALSKKKENLQQLVESLCEMEKSLDLGPLEASNTKNEPKRPGKEVQKNGIGVLPWTRLLLVSSPTASGKTDHVELALKVNGEIISADSMQIYQR